MVRRWWQAVRKLSLVMAAALGLIAAGIVSLVLSEAVGGGWWQGTLQALGVGLVVGGLVDVLAISKLNQVIQSASNQHQAKSAQEAEAIVARGPDDDMDWYLNQLRDNTIPIETRAAVLRRLHYKKRVALLGRLDSKLGEQLLAAGVYKP